MCGKICTANKTFQDMHQKGEFDRIFVWFHRLSQFSIDYPKPLTVSCVCDRIRLQAIWCIALSNYSDSLFISFEPSWWIHTLVQRIVCASFKAWMSFCGFVTSKSNGIHAFFLMSQVGTVFTVWFEKDRVVVQILRGQILQLWNLRLLGQKARINDFRID